MDNIILCKQGYLIPKISKYKNQIEILKKELNVEPYQPYTFSKNDVPVKFNVYQENDDYYSIPKYYGLKKFGKPDINKEIIGSEININFNGDLRPLQKEIINKVIPYIKINDGGVLVLPCAAGKTVLSLYLAAVLKVKTLVIVHKTFLLNQWKERAEQFTNAKIGIIQQNKIDIDDKDIVIGMLQSIAKDKYESTIFKDFGLVIFDEAHHAPSKYFSKALPIINCKKTLALSATPNRSDRLEKILFWYFGDILYKQPTETLNNVLVKMIKFNSSDLTFKEYKQNFGNDVNRPKTINKLTELEPRNKLIIKIIKEILIEADRKLLILSDRIEHLKILYNSISVLQITTCGYYIGGMKQSKLDESTKAQIIFASYSMAQEALDIPELNTLLMITPRKEIEQAVGRITRKKDHLVQPLVIDIVDKLPIFDRQSKHRKKFYNTKEFIIKLYEASEDKIINEITDINKIKESKINKVELDNLNFID